MEKDEKLIKWECQLCTYLNFSKSIRCCMCNSKKEAIEIFSLSRSDKLSHDDTRNPCGIDDSLNYDGSLSLTEKVKKLELKTSNPDLSLNLKRTNSPLASSSNTPNLDSASVDQKWECMACTYKNFLRSSKCIMCGTKKGSINIIQNIISNENDYIENEDDENLACGASNYNTSSSSMVDDKNNTAKNNLKNLPYKYQINTNELEAHQAVRQLKRHADWVWLNAVAGVVENDLPAVEKYLSRGGNVGRTLTSNEVLLLNRPSAFDVGYTLIHLAIRFHRDELLSRLLAQISSNGPSGIKCVGEQIAPDIAEKIRKHFGQILRIRKPPFSCSYVNEHATFSLPADIEELPISIQEQLYDELLDRDAQKQLENPPPALNWSLEITSRLGSKLLALWNRSAGDCLLDACMQACYNVFDRDNLLRRALSDSLHQCSPFFYARWKEYEMAYHQALLHFTLEEQQWEEDWKNLITLASQPGASLEQLHIFVLCHIFRRPIIVYGVKYVKSYRGDAISPARFEGLYLPLLWEQSFCIKSPIALGYTRGHFSALVPLSKEPYQRLDESREEDVTFLPLMSCDNKIIPIHFLSQSEMGHEDKLMRSWLDVCFTEGGLMVAQQKLHKRPLLVEQMMEEWLNYYRRKAQIISPLIHRGQQVIGLEGYLSDGDTDEE